MNEDAYLEKVAEELYNQANARGYQLFKYSPEDPKYGPSTCDECGIDMPLARREYGYRLCVPCKSLTE